MSGGVVERLAGRLAALTTAQLAGAIAVLSAAALTGSLMLTGVAVRADQREKAALLALQDYSAMISKLGVESSFGAGSLTATDAAYLSAWLSAFQSRPGDGASIAETCSEGRGGAGVRLIQAPGAKPAGLAALGQVRAEAQPGLGEDVYLMRLPRGALCAGRAVAVVAVRQEVGLLEITVGRVVERSGAAWGRAVAAILTLGLVILILGVGVAALSRRRLIRAVGLVSDSLDHAAVGDFSRRAPEIGIAPELTQLTIQVNRTLDRLDELLAWLRDSSDQLAHDFRTPLARAGARLDQLSGQADPATRDRLIEETKSDLAVLRRAMDEAVALRDGEAWLFEDIPLDRIAASVVDLYEPLAEAKGIRIEASLDEASVMGVRSLLQRAVANLMDNAVKFSPPDAVLTIRVEADDEARRLIVADAGPGMQAPPDPTTESHGMGLPFVRAVARRHGARLSISDAAPGTVVTLEFSR